MTKEENEIFMEDGQEMSWDSDLVIFRPHIILQEGVREVVINTQRHHKSYEFSMLFMGSWLDRGVFFVRNRYIIPEQEVERASVDYLESIAELRQLGYNTVVHSHPFAADSYFSEEDDETINSHFPCSLLSNNRGRIIRGNLLVDMYRPTDANPHRIEKLSIPIENYCIDTKTEEIEVVGIDKIKKKPKKKVFRAAETELPEDVLEPAPETVL